MSRLPERDQETEPGARYACERPVQCDPRARVPACPSCFVRLLFKESALTDFKKCDGVRDLYRTMLEREALLWRLHVDRLVTEMAAGSRVVAEAG